MKVLNLWLGVIGSIASIVGFVFFFWTPIGPPVPEVTAENLDIVAADYTGSPNGGSGAILIKKPGVRPYFLTMYWKPGREYMTVAVVKTERGRFSTIWEADLDYEAFGLHLGGFKQDSGNILFEGAVPHLAGHTWSFLMYSPVFDQGYIALFQLDKTDNYEVLIPHRPDSYAAPEFIYYFLKHMAPSELRLLAEKPALYDLNDSRLRAAVLLQTDEYEPRDLLPLLIDTFDNNTWPRVLRGLACPSTTLAPDDLQHVYLAEFDGDSRLEWLVIARRNLEEATVYLLDEKCRRLKEFEKDIVSASSIRLTGVPRGRQIIATAYNGGNLAALNIVHTYHSTERGLQHLSREEQH